MWQQPNDRACRSRLAQRALWLHRTAAGAGLFSGSGTQFYGSETMFYGSVTQFSGRRTQFVELP